MMRLVLRWLDSPWAFELLPGLNRLGRNPTNDFRISDPSVSSFHAEIVMESDAVRVRDLGSTNGTFIDDVKTSEGELLPNNILRFGNVRFAVQEVLVTPAVQAPATPATASPAATQVDLAPPCSYHSGVRAAYRCENCGGCFCAECITVVGQGKFEATTVCPVCNGQCYPLISPAPGEHRRSLFGRLTDTLRLPFSH